MTRNPPPGTAKTSQSAVPTGGVRAKIGLRTRLLVMVLTLAVPAAGFLIYSARRDYAEVATRAEQHVLDAARSAANGVEEFLALAQSSLEGLAARRPENLLDPTECADRIADAAASLPFLAFVSVADASGTIFCSSAAEFAGTMDVSDREWFRDAKEGNAFVIGAPIEGRMRGNWGVALSAPIRDDQGRFAGVVAGSIVIDDMIDIAEHAVPGEDETITITDNDEVVLSRSVDVDAWRGRNISQPVYPTIATGEDWVVFNARPDPQTSRYVGRVDLPHREWRIYASFDEGLLFAAGWRDAQRNALAGFALLFLALLTALAGYRNLAGSIEKLVEGARSAASGMPMPLPVGGPPEIRAVAEQFNKTLAARTRAEDRHRAFFQNAPFAAGISALDGRLLAVNRTMVETLGYDHADELIGTGPVALYEDAEARERMLSSLIEAGEFHDVEVTWMRKDGGARLMRLSGRYIEDDDEARIEAVGEDITEQRRLEESERHRQKTEAISRLAGGVSHEINNVLTVIAGNAGVLEADLGPNHPSHAEALEIAKAVERGTELTRSLLAISRRDISPPTDLDVAAALDEMGSMLERVLPAGIKLVTEVAKTHRTIRMNRSHFEQLILNLVVNAKDAMPDGGVVHINTKVEELDTQSELLLSVRDEGTGIPAELIDRIFEPYFTTKPRGDGTGLGLATVQGLVAQAGGTMHVSSIPGVGSHFVVRIPTTQPKARVAPATASD